ISGALSAVSATSNWRTLWSNMQSNPTNAQAALSAFGNISGFLSMVSASARQPTGTSQAVSAAAFPGCVTLSASGQSGSATFSDCTAGGVTLRGTASKEGDSYSASL